MGVPAPMDRDEADRALASLGEAYDRGAAAMYTVDSHAGLAYLKGGILTGRTQATWEEVRTQVDLLWAWFSALGNRLELARGIRAQRSRLGGDELAELSRLLRDKVIRLDAAGMPVEGASAVEGGGRVRLAELASMVESGAARITATLTTVDTACASLVGVLAPTTERVTEVQALAVQFGTGADPAITRLDTELSALRKQALDDPLGAADTGSGFAGRIERLAADAATARAGLADLIRLREDFPSRVSRLRSAAGELAAEEERTRQAYVLAVEKIANPGLPEAPAKAAELADRIASLDDAGHCHSDPHHPAHRKDWPRISAKLSELDHDLTAAADRARQLREAASGLLDRRVELRGRLDAYRAKAARLGFAEHNELTVLHHEARDLLYTKPCDLPAATQAVRRYQELLAGLAEGDSAGAQREPSR